MPEEPRETLLAEEPEPVPRAPEESPKASEPAVAERREPGRTQPDVRSRAEVFAEVFAVDPTGDLWIRRGNGEEGRAGAFETVSMGDSVSTRASGGGFTLEGRATVVLERDAHATFCYFKPEQAYRMDLLKGLVMVDTEGFLQNWRVAQGGITVSFMNFRGRLAFEARGESLSAVVLEGGGEVRSATLANRVDAGREVVASSEGKIALRRAQVRPKANRLTALRPRHSTAFSATFDEPEGKRPFPYHVAWGSVVPEDASGSFLRAAGAEGTSPSLRAVLRASVRPDRPLVYTTGMILRFRYRTHVPVFLIQLSRFSMEVKSDARGGNWTDEEVSVDRFEHEGIEILPHEEIGEVRFEAGLEKNAGGLDVDAIHFLRRAP